MVDNIEGRGWVLRALLNARTRTPPHSPEQHDRKNQSGKVGKCVNERRYSEVHAILDLNAIHACGDVYSYGQPALLLHSVTCLQNSDARRLPDESNVLNRCTLI